MNVEISNINAKNDLFLPFFSYYAIINLKLIKSNFINCERRNCTLETFLYTIINACIVLFACTGFLLISLKKWQKGILFLYLFLVLFFFQDILGQRVTPLAVAGTIIFICIFDHHFAWNITTSLLGYIFSVTLNYLSIVFCIQVLQISKSKLYQEYSLLFSCCFLIFLWICTLAVQHFLNIKKHFLLQEKLPQKLSYIVCIFLCLCSLLYIVTIIYNEIFHYSISYLLLTCSLFFLFFSFLISILYSLFKAWSQKKQMELKLANFQVLQEYSDKLEQEYIKLRAFKHDYANIIASLYSYVEEGDLAGLQDYFQKHLFCLKEEMATDDSKLALLSKLEVPELKGLFFTKLTLALHHNLILQLEITEPFFLSDRKHIIELTRILGIFLDNAIEAALESHKKELFVVFLSDTKKIVILIQNSISTPVADLAEIFSLNYSTKGKNRGIGLYQAKQLLDKQDNLFLTTNQKDGYFYQKLEIYK